VIVAPGCVTVLGVGKHRSSYNPSASSYKAYIRGRLLGTEVSSVGPGAVEILPRQAWKTKVALRMS
jgi:hypothetical protein